MSFISLERKLPILIGSLVACALLATLLLVRWELRSNAVDVAGERLQIVTAQLDELVEGSVSNRIELTGEVAADPAIVDYAAGRTGDTDAVRAALERLRVESDSGLAIELRTMDGQVLVSTASDEPTPATVAPEDHDPLLPRLPADSVTYTQLETRDGEVRYHIVAPVRIDDRIAAHVVHERRIGTSGNSEQIERLIGNRAQIYFTNRAGGVWTSLDGDIRLDVPPLAAIDEPVQYDYGGQRLYAVGTAIAGTDWLIITQMPLDAALVSTGRVLRRLTIVGVLLLLLGGLGAWLVSRSVTAPLKRLGEAADAIAAGDYRRRTGLARDDEIGHLAGSFDVMAARIHETHSELAQRYDQAQALSAELELTNRRLTEAVREAERAGLEAQQASSAKSEFLATMSHEIRTPINAILGYTELMEMELSGPLTARQREYIGRVRRSGSHLIALVNDVLDFAKIEAGQLRLQEEVGTFAADIAVAVPMLDTAARSRRLTIDVACDARGQYRGDPQRVQQILINLLSNAVKFSHDEGTVSITCERRDSRALHAGSGTPAEITWACLNVIDSGIGIEDDQKEAIFEPFVQGSGGYTRRHGGTGLGLAISRSLARMMGGDVTVDSQVGRGSTFTLWLPAA